MSECYIALKDALDDFNDEQANAQLRAYAMKHICLKILGIPPGVSCDRTDAYFYPPRGDNDWNTYRIIGLDNEGQVHTAWILALDFDEQVEEMMQKIDS